MNSSLLAIDLRHELCGHLLPFWRERAVEGQGDGFIAHMDSAGRVDESANRGLILNSRILWTFSAAFRFTSDKRDLQLAERAYAYLQNHFYDAVNGGYFWELDPDGQPLDRLKKTYGQAFCIYALSEYCRATKQAAARESAIHAFELLEQHALDPTFGGYFEVCRADWSVAIAERLSDKDQADPKSMNNQLHVLEAYTNLYRIWPEQRVADRLLQLLDVFERFLLNAEQTHLHHFFEEDWTVRSTSYTYGHDIEAAWLLCETAQVLGHKEVRQRVGRWAVRIATAVLDEGLDQDGGLLYEGRDGKPIDRGKEWWPQAEAVVGFLHVHQITNDPAFLEAAIRVWSFIQRCLIDSQHGEWHWRIGPDGQPDATLPKISAWKGPYHNTRMCLEALQRIEPTAKHGTAH